jgi:putative flavoprotein involved in K+ transport
MIDVVVIGAGQSGLTAARTLRTHGISPVVLEAGPEPAGSWPRYYDSLALFSPARFSTVPGQDFPGDPDHYPHRDEVVEYLRHYAATLGAEIRTNTGVTEIHTHPESGFAVHTTTGGTLHTAGIVAATGSFGNPNLPALPGEDQYTGRVLHSADYRNPKQYVGERIIVVGGGNSAMQIAYELADVATVTLATHQPIGFLPQIRDGHDVHHWLATTGFDLLPPEWLIHYVGGPLVSDPGAYSDALASGRLDRRAMFTAFHPTGVTWPNGTDEPVDTVIYATGYRPHVGYLESLDGALDDNGMPRHTGGVSATHPGLVYLGLEFQQSFSSNTLRGVHRDAAHVIPALTAHVHDAPAQVGL